MIAAIMGLIFLLGYLLGKSGKFYFYIDGKPHSLKGSDRYMLYLPNINGLGVDLFGIDYTDGTLMPVYRPTIRFIKQDGFRVVGIRTGDFHEIVVLMSYRFPFIKVRYESVLHARSYDE